MFLAVAALFATLFQPLKSGAVRTLDLEVFGRTVSPKQLIAQAGDSLRFTFTDGTHKLASYATSGTTIDFGQVRGDAFRPPVMSTEFLGGIVWYRCEFHSRIFTANGVCEGMCASISDDDTVPPPPAIDQPTRMIRERPATISGTSVPLSLVTLVEGTTTESGTYRGQALADANGRWSVQTVDFGTVGGNRRLVARSTTAAGHVSADSPVVIYGYNPDLQAPDISFDDVGVPIFVGEMTFSGTAVDNVGIRAVQLTFATIEVNPSRPEAPVNTGRIFTLPATCMQGCPNQTIGWQFNTSVLVGQLPVGVYQVSATAFDTSNNIASASAPTSIGQSVVVFVSPEGVRNALPEQLRSAVPTAMPTVAASPVPPVLPSPLPSA